MRENWLEPSIYLAYLPIQIMIFLERITSELDYKLEMAEFSWI